MSDARYNNIYLRKDGRWEARYAIMKDENGKKKYRSVYGETKEEAYENRLVAMIKLKEIFKKTHRFVGDLPNKPSPITKDYSCEKWFVQLLLAESKYRGERTLEKYRMLLGKFILPAFGNTPISMITPDAINELTNDMFADYNGKRLAYEVVWLLRKGMLKAVKEGLLRYDPCSYLTRPNKKDFFTYYVKEDTFAGSPESDDYQLKAALCLMQETRLQLGKILSLKWRDIDLEQRRILLNNTYQEVAIEPVIKPNLKELPLTELTYSILKKMQSPYAEDFVFRKDRGLWTEENIDDTYYEMDSRNR